MGDAFGFKKIQRIIILDPGNFIFIFKLNYF